jgi:hypothetical protein
MSGVTAMPATVFVASMVFVAGMAAMPGMFLMSRVLRLLAVPGRRRLVAWMRLALGVVVMALVGLVWLDRFVLVAFFAHGLSPANSVDLPGR